MRRHPRRRRGHWNVAQTAAATLCGGQRNERRCARPMLAICIAQRRAEIARLAFCRRVLSIENVCRGVGHLRLLFECRLGAALSGCDTATVATRWTNFVSASVPLPEVDFAAAAAMEWRSGWAWVPCLARLHGTAVICLHVGPRVLAAKSTSGSGTLADTKFVQRVATVGGVAPTQAAPSRPQTASAGALHRGITFSIDSTPPANARRAIFSAPLGDAYREHRPRRTDAHFVDRRKA